MRVRRWLLRRFRENSFCQTADYGAPYSSPVPFRPGGRKCVAAFNLKGLYVFDLTDGSEVCHFDWPAPAGVNAATPLVDGDRIFIASGYGQGCALLRYVDGAIEQVWSNKNMRAQFNSPILYEGHIYGFDDSQFQCLDVETGEVVWNHEGLGRGLPTMADGKFIIMSEKSELVIVEATPEEYREISNASLMGGECRTIPVLANSHIYIRNTRGDLVCVDVAGQ